MTEKTIVNPMVGRNCIVRTYSAGVHWGHVEYVLGKEVYLTSSIRIWCWEGGGLSLSAIANEGMKGGRTERTGEILLTEAIELIPTTELAEKTYEECLE